MINPVVGSLNTILKNVNRIMDTITTKIEDTISKSNWSSLQQEQYEQGGQVTELPDSVKRSISNETSEGIKGLFKNINRIMDKLAVKVEDSIEKANWTLIEEASNSEVKGTVSTRRDLSADTPALVTNLTASLPPTTTTNKYKKIGEYYKKKFADKFINLGEDETAPSGKSRRDVDENFPKINITGFNERYAEAGKEFSDALQELTLDLISSYGNKTTN